MSVFPESSRPFSDVPDECFFPDRSEECARIGRFLASPNHLILTGPKGSGKTSLVLTAVHATSRPFVYVDVSQALSVTDLAALLLQSFLSLFAPEDFRDLVAGFRAWPTITYDAGTNTFGASFPAGANPDAALEDVLSVLEKKSDPERRLVVIFDEFQEILSLGAGLDGKLRTILQLQENINYVFVGSRESAMTELFGNVRSPFFHFGLVMRPAEHPRDEIARRLAEHWAPVAKERSQELAEKVLAVTNARPPYTRMLAETVEEALLLKVDDPLSFALGRLMHRHNLDYERQWRSFNLTNRKVIEAVSRNAPLHVLTDLRESTVYTAAGRLVKEGVLIRTSRYEVEDPFFALWIRRQRQRAALSSASPDF